MCRNIILIIILAYISLEPLRNNKTKQSCFDFYSHSTLFSRKGVQASPAWSRETLSAC